MREIKFRAWEKGNKVMYRSPDLDAFEDAAAWFRLLEDEDYSLEYMSPIVLMQYTGLKDKNGTEIYEGDVLAAQGQVIWNDEEHQWSAIDLNWNDRREWHELEYLTSPFEVIGNIYENPELVDKPIDGTKQK